MLLVLLSLVSLKVLGHGVDLPLGGVQHDGEDLEVSQQPQLAEASSLAALPHQQLGQTRLLDGLLSLFHPMLLHKTTKWDELNYLWNMKF